LFQGLSGGQVTSFDTNGKWLVAGLSDGVLDIIDLSNGTTNSKFRHGSGSGERYRGVTKVLCLRTPCAGFTSDLFFSGCSNGMIKAWCLPGLASNEVSGYGIAEAGDSKPALSSYWGIRMNLRLKQSITTIKLHSAPISAMIGMSCEGSSPGWLLASGDLNGLVCLSRGTAKSSTATSVSTLVTQSGKVKDTVIKTSISCLDFIGSQVVPTLVNHDAKIKAGKKMNNPANAVGSSGTGAFTGDNYLGVGTANGQIAVLDVTTARAIYQVNGHLGRVNQLIGLRANEFISCSSDRSIKLWDIRTRNRPTHNFAGKILEERSLGPNSYKRCASSSVTRIAVGGGDNSLVISTSADGVVRLWDRRYDVNVPCCVTQGHTNRITSLVWDGIGEFYTASHDGTVRSWDSINGQNVSMLQAYEDEGIQDTKMSRFKCYQQVSMTPRGPVYFTNDTLGSRTCVVTASWNGSLKAFVNDK
jgi:hypothetical protein